ncbi:hypothetical protein SAMN03003324_00119 [Pedobacter antarcticus]|uniref:Uncharacterized protein n=1 Tax=Pedobacter antarcticus TaxID=34086 RepID=A0A1I1ZP77_9SPHI|nr:hypothetical protein [Pedobacter antarcticus]SFE33432.1 hypothetical protein SAMN03003324_00119 [Pedobacter antarcticus]
MGNVIFLFEYKAHTFPEDQILIPNSDKFTETGSQDALLRASTSFDAFYYQHLAAPTKGGSIPDKLKELIGLANISLDELKSSL